VRNVLIVLLWVSGGDCEKYAYCITVGEVWKVGEMCSLSHCGRVLGMVRNVLLVSLVWAGG
jgi:hypothetical protein